MPHYFGNNCVLGELQDEDSIAIMNRYDELNNTEKLPIGKSKSQN